MSSIFYSDHMKTLTRTHVDADETFIYFTMSALVIMEHASLFLIVTRALYLAILYRIPTMKDSLFV